MKSYYLDPALIDAMIADLQAYRTQNYDSKTPLIGWTDIVTLINKHKAVIRNWFSREVVVKKVGV